MVIVNIEEIITLQEKFNHQMSLLNDCVSDCVTPDDYVLTEVGYRHHDNEGIKKYSSKVGFIHRKSNHNGDAFEISQKVVSGKFRMAQNLNGKSEFIGLLTPVNLNDFTYNEIRELTRNDKLCVVYTKGNRDFNGNRDFKVAYYKGETNFRDTSVSGLGQTLQVTSARRTSYDSIITIKKELDYIDFYAFLIKDRVNKISFNNEGIIRFKSKKTTSQPAIYS